MANDINETDWQETYRSLITLATEGFKYCSLANGGAAVAILAYLGNDADKGYQAPDMRCSMALLLLGLFFGGCSMFFAYLTQLKRLNQLANGKNTRGDWRLTMSIFSIGFSLLFFIIGSLLAVTSFS